MRALQAAASIFLLSVGGCASLSDWERPIPSTWVRIEEDLATGVFRIEVSNPGPGALCIDTSAWPAFDGSVVDGVVDGGIVGPNFFYVEQGGKTFPATENLVSDCFIPCRARIKRGGKMSGIVLLTEFPGLDISPTGAKRTLHHPISNRVSCRGAITQD
jgi:hypothetical protein